MVLRVNKEWILTYHQQQARGTSGGHLNLDTRRGCGGVTKHTD